MPEKLGLAPKLLQGLFGVQQAFYSVKLPAEPSCRTPTQRARGSKKLILARTHEKKPFPHARNFHSRLKFSFSVCNFRSRLIISIPGPVFLWPERGPEWKKPFPIENFIPYWKLDFFNIASRDWIFSILGPSGGGVHQQFATQTLCIHVLSIENLLLRLRVHLFRMKLLRKNSSSKRKIRRGEVGRTKHRHIPKCEGDKQWRVPKSSLPRKTL